MHGCESGKRGAGLIALAAACAIVPGGCVTEGPPPKPRPRAVPEQPSGLAPDRLLPSASPVLADTDRNGFVDTLTVTVYMFARGYDLPVTAEGSFEFTMRAADGTIVHTWMIDEAATRGAYKLFMPGPGYQFDLSLLDGKKGDQMPAQRGELLSKFTSRSGTVIESRAPLTVTLGPAPGAGS